MHSNSKERGMIFNAEMVRAILSGQKTQTRRIMKNQPAGDYPDSPVMVRNIESGFQWHGKHGESSVFPYPLGTVGDRIWVRETWARYNVDQDSHDLAYRATTPEDWPPNGAIWRPVFRSCCPVSQVMAVLIDVVPSPCFTNPDAVANSA